MIFLLDGTSQLFNEFFISSSEPKTKVRISSNEGIEGLRNALASVSMFEEDAIVITDLDNWKKADRKDAAHLIVNHAVNRNIFLISRNEKPDEAKRVTLDQPKPWNSKAWQAHVKRIADELELRISSEATEKLLDLCGSDELIIYNEMMKLSAVCSSINEELVVKYCAYHQTARLDDVAYLAIGGKSNTALKEMASLNSEESFPIFCSILGGLLIDMKVVHEHLDGSSKRLAWSAIQEISRSTGIGSARVARITGYSFSSSRETNRSLLDEIRGDLIPLIIDNLQQIDEDYKLGRNNGFVAFIRVLSMLEKTGRAGKW